LQWVAGKAGFQWLVAFRKGYSAVDVAYLVNYVVSLFRLLFRPLVNKSTGGLKDLIGTGRPGNRGGKAGQ
jgi:hypothetical protein